MTRSTLKQYRDSTAVTELKQFEGRGHSLTIDSGWREVAEAILELAEGERPRLGPTYCRRGRAASPGRPQTPVS